MEDFIQVKKRKGIVRFGIKDENGNDTGNYLEFDMESIEYPLKLNKCDILHKKNLEYLKNEFVIIDKKEDHKGLYLLSWKEEKKLEVIKEFYKREMEALDLFLGKDGCKKILNGREPYYSMYEDIAEMIEQILPKLKMSSDEINKKIKEKYSEKKEENVIE